MKALYLVIATIFIVLSGDAYGMRRNGGFVVKPLTNQLMTNDQKLKPADQKIVQETYRKLGYQQLIPTQYRSSHNHSSRLFSPASAVTPHWASKKLFIHQLQWNNLNDTQKKHAVAVAIAHTELHHPIKRKLESSSGSILLTVGLACIGCARIASFKPYSNKLMGAGAQLAGAAWFKECFLDNQLWYQAARENWYQKQELDAERLATQALGDAAEMLALANEQLKQIDSD